jgi:ATP-binding cassette, subfamily B, bacterial
LSLFRERLAERLAELRELVRLLPWVLRLLWDSHPLAAFWLAGLTFFQALSPVAQLWVAKLLMDQLVLIIRLPAAQRGGEPVATALLYVALEAAILIASALLGLLAGHTRNILQEALVYNVQERVLEQSARLDLQAYESPLYYDQLQRARTQVGEGPIQLLGAMLEVAQGGLTLLSVGTLVLFFRPWVALLLTLTTLPSFWAMIHYGWRRFRLFDLRTPDGRRAEYLSDVLSTDTFAKEIRVWGISRYLLDQVLVLRRRFQRENLSLSRSQAFGTAFGEVLSTCGYYASYLVVVLGVIAGRLTLGELTLYAGAFTRMQSLFENVLLGVANVYQLQLFARNLQIFLSLEPAIAKPPQPGTLAEPIREIAVDNLSFTYPGTDELVLDRVSFRLSAGECIALVGENGAGKTTLVKLLLRLYEPSAGTIRTDGLDLRELDPEAWRSRVAVVFQDYARFQLTARENVGVGKVAAIEDLESIEEAARAAGIDAAISALPEGYETLLGRQFEGGCELSLGQWQRLALARALLRDAPLLIMDEPTAAMDPQAEYDLYRQLRELARGRMTLLISHRFSTVRMADRILVLQGNRVVEEGTHEELLAREGWYARMFRLQAESYRIPEPQLAGVENGAAAGVAGFDDAPLGIALGG